MPADLIDTAARLLQPTASIVTLAVAIRLARQSKRWTDGLDAIERIAPLVEGDPKEHKDNAKRYGLLGRVTFLEDNASASANKLQTVARRLIAVLRGMNVPSDLSDDHETEKLVKQALKSTPINRVAATEALLPHRKRKE